MRRPVFRRRTEPIREFVDLADAIDEVRREFVGIVTPPLEAVARALVAATNRFRPKIDPTDEDRDA